MKYMLLIYSDEKQWETMTPAENQATMQEYFAFTRSIQENGQHLAGEGLQPTTTATTVRVRGGQLQTTDGPFAETREQLGGYYLLDAKDLNEAIQIAAKIPAARTGSIEVRPVMEFPDQNAGN